MDRTFPLILTKNLLNKCHHASDERPERPGYSHFISTRCIYFSSVSTALYPLHFACEDLTIFSTFPSAMGNALSLSYQQENRQTDDVIFSKASDCNSAGQKMSVRPWQRNTDHLRPKDSDNFSVPFLFRPSLAYQSLTPFSGPRL